MVYDGTELLFLAWLPDLFLHVQPSLSIIVMPDIILISVWGHFILLPPVFLYLGSWWVVPPVPLVSGGQCSDVWILLSAGLGAAISSAAAVVASTSWPPGYLPETDRIYIVSLLYMCAQVGISVMHNF